MTATRKTNAPKLDRVAIAAHATLRASLLNGIANAIGTVEDRVRLWTQSEFAALKQKATTFDAIRADCCGKFPRFTGKKKTLSDTPNDSFRSHLDRFKVLACVLSFADMQDAATYRTPEIVAFVNGWANGGKASLSATVATVQEMRRAAKPKANLSKADREKAKAVQHIEESAKLGEATALNPIAMRTLAATLEGATVERLEGFGSVLAELLAATRNAAKRLNDAEKAARKTAKAA